jgi:putative flippase GtrA
LSSFSLVGATVTLISATASVVLLKFFLTPLILTYVCVYGSSITLSYFLNSIFTFQSAMSSHKLALYFGIYLSSMGLGVVLLKFYRAVLPFENWVLPLLVIPFTALWNYGLSSKLMLRSRIR